MYCLTCCKYLLKIKLKLGSLNYKLCFVLKVYCHLRLCIPHKVRLNSIEDSLYIKFIKVENASSFRNLFSSELNLLKFWISLHENDTLHSHICKKKNSLHFDIQHDHICSKHVIFWFYHYQMAAIFNFWLLHKMLKGATWASLGFLFCIVYRS